MQILLLPPGLCHSPPPPAAFFLSLPLILIPGDAERALAPPSLITQEPSFILCRALQRPFIGGGASSTAAASLSNSLGWPIRGLPHRASSLPEVGWGSQVAELEVRLGTKRKQTQAACEVDLQTFWALQMSPLASLRTDNGTKEGGMSYSGQKLHPQMPHQEERGCGVF